MNVSGNGIPFPKYNLRGHNSTPTKLLAMKECSSSKVIIEKHFRMNYPSSPKITTNNNNLEWINMIMDKIIRLWIK